MVRHPEHSEGSHESETKFSLQFAVGSLQGGEEMADDSWQMVVLRT